MSGNAIRISVLGATGMLGSAVFSFLADSPGLEVSGTTRSSTPIRHFRPDLRRGIDLGVDVDNFDSLAAHFARARPDVVINCVGLVKQLAGSEDPLMAIAVNALLPHRLARLCKIAGARLIHVSTDCVFAGTRGNYREEDVPDARDLYGRSKLLGEVTYPHAITLRTSIIGHQLGSAHSLLEWFLSQQSEVKGYTRAIFSGLPTIELARVIRDYVLPRPEMSGLYHVSAAPISKYELLKLVSRQYGKNIPIVADDKVIIDRSLDSSRFQSVAGYRAPDWPELIARMHQDSQRRENGGDVRNVR